MNLRLNNYFQGKKILITGGAGYLASALVALLNDVDCQIICLDQRKSIAVLKEKVAKITDFMGDVSIKETWEKVLPGMDIVFHFAAQTSVYFANDNPLADYERNVLPMLYLLETCRQKKLKPTILFSGTVTETGMPVKLPVDETHPDNPVTVYDLHKLMAENYLKYYSLQGTVNGTILRLVNVYGPGPVSSSADRGILNMMVRKAVKGEDLTLYGQGEFLRDYIFVQDAAMAFLYAALNIEKVQGGHYVIGTGKGVTLAEAFNLVVERVGAKKGKKVKVVSIEPPADLSIIENRNFVANSSKFSALTGWQAEYSLIQGIYSLIKSVLEQ